MYNSKLISISTHVYKKPALVAILDKHFPVMIRHLFFDNLTGKIPEHVRVLIHSDERLLQKEILEFIQLVDQLPLPVQDKVLLVTKLADLLGMGHLELLADSSSFQHD